MVEDLGATPSELGAAVLASDPENDFVHVAGYLSRSGIRVPRIYRHQPQLGLTIIEDLGGERLLELVEAASDEKIRQIYEDVIRRVAHMHNELASPPSAARFAQRSMGRQLLRDEIHHFREWGLQADGAILEGNDLDTFESAADRLADDIARLPIGFLHRDVQSKNIMFKNDEWVFIDIQDAMMGPYVYDLVALLCDSYVTIDDHDIDALIGHYAQSRKLPADEVKRDFWRIALQRKLKDYGRFHYLDRIKGNSSFLPYLPRTRELILSALERADDYPELRRLLLSQTWV